MHHVHNRIQPNKKAIRISADRYDLHLVSNGIESVEMRGVEPLSESSLTGLSPSAFCGLDFPRPTAHRQADGSGSFIIQACCKA